MGKIKILKSGLVAVVLGGLLFISGCIPTGEEGGGFDWTFIVILVGMFILLYFLMIRPQQKRQKEHQHMLDELNRGDTVITAGGIYGRVESISDETVVLKVESGATIRVARNSVSIKQPR